MTKKYIMLNVRTGGFCLLFKSIQFLHIFPILHKFDSVAYS